MTWGLTVLMICLAGMAYAEGTILLPKPPAKIHMDLFSALALRRSTNTFAAGAPDTKQLSTLLWAANGVNRPDGKRTAPSAMNTQCITIYYVCGDGAYRYDAAGHSLLTVSTEDVRAQVGKQGFVGKAPGILVLTTDLSKYPPVPGKKNDWMLASQASAGFVGQNIYLAAAALKLGTRYVMSVNVPGTKKALRLGKHEEPIAAMPVGPLAH